MDRHFACTACGKCCYGWLPLTIGDALAHSDRFPLFIVWTPVREGGRSFEIAARLGITIKLKARRRAAVQISPTAYIPPRMACPELTDAGLCAVHANKPLRCRAMPFSASRDEADQNDLLIPRAGWLCDTSESAPTVYRDNTIISRQDFDREREELVRDAAVLRPYAEWLLDSVPKLAVELDKVAMRPAGGKVVVDFLTLIPHLPKVNIYDLARRQYPVMQAFAAKVAGQKDYADYERRYGACASEWERIANQQR